MVDVRDSEIIFLKYEDKRTIENNSQYQTEKVTDNCNELILFRVLSITCF